MKSKSNISYLFVLNSVKFHKFIATSIDSKKKQIYFGHSSKMTKMYFFIEP